MTEYKVTPDGDGCIRVTHTFRGESEYYVRIFKEGARIVQLSVYAVLPDLVGRYPYMGDMHMHSTMSDGKEHPYIVAANYRKSGYDFMATRITENFIPLWRPAIFTAI